MTVFATHSRFAALALALALVLACVRVPTAGAQELRLDWAGEIKADMRFEVADEVPIERMETWLSGKVSGRFGDHALGVARLDFVFVHRPDPQDFAGLTDRQALEPIRFESDALFVELIDIGLDGLDVRIGRQQVIWGEADRFHPTSNFNALDVEDPLEFGDTIANQMIRLRYQPWVIGGDEDEPWFEELTFEAVWVPSHMAAQLPQSGELAFTDPDETIRLAQSEQLKGLAKTFKGFVDGGASVAWDLRIQQPDFDLSNSMVGAKVGWTLLSMDMSLSYFRGFEDFPRAERASVSGSPSDLNASAQLTYPRIQVFGADLAADVPVVGIGVWAEVGVFFHDDLYLMIDGRQFLGYESIEALDTPPVKEHEQGHFVKVAAGMDYTIFPWWYVNVQYLYGFIDEFGKNDLKHYIVPAMDFKLGRDRFVLRLAGIASASDGSFVAFPQLIMKPWSSMEWTVGAFLFSGLFGLETDTKFGSPVAGASTVFTRATFSF